MDACNVTNKKIKNRILAKSICILFMLILVFVGFLKCMDFSNQLEVYYYGNNSSSYQGEMAQTLTVGAGMMFSVVWGIVPLCLKLVH